jgi:hypothetical protein
MNTTINRPILTLTKKPKNGSQVTEIVKEEKTEQVKVGENPTPQQLELKQKIPVRIQAWYLDILSQLRVKCARAFPGGTKRKLPLAIGVHKEIATKLKITEKVARSFCKHYCSSKSYQTICVKGAQRYNLKGEITGIVGEPKEKPIDNTKNTCNKE